MSNLRVPKELYTERNHLYGAMKIVVSNFNGVSCSVEEIIRLLPQNLKEKVELSLKASQMKNKE